MPSAGARARGEHMARIGRLHHERLTDRVSWPKRELQENRFPVPRIRRVHNWVLCARRAVDLARLRATQNRRSGAGEDWAHNYCDYFK